MNEFEEKKDLIEMDFHKFGLVEFAKKYGLSLQKARELIRDLDIAPKVVAEITKEDIDEEIDENERLPFCKKAFESLPATNTLWNLKFIAPNIPVETAPLIPIKQLRTIFTKMRMLRNGRNVGVPMACLGEACAFKSVCEIAITGELLRAFVGYPCPFEMEILSGSLERYVSDLTGSVEIAQALKAIVKLFSTEKPVTIDCDEIEKLIITRLIERLKTLNVTVDQDFLTSSDLADMHHLAKLDVFEWRITQSINADGGKTTQEVRSSTPDGSIYQSRIEPSSNYILLQQISDQRDKLLKRLGITRTQRLARKIELSKLNISLERSRLGKITDRETAVDNIEDMEKAFHGHSFNRQKS